MKILHTSDFHLGAWLESRDKSRVPEQISFISELCQICSDENIELVLIAGDVFDSYMPSAEAETVFYDAMERLSDGGARPVVVIAGNHDDPARLTAADPILSKRGVMLFGTPNSVPADYENEYYRVKSVQKCCAELHIKKTDETAVIAAMPYPSEKRLNERLTGDGDFNEESYRSSYSAKIGGLLAGMAANFRADTFNIIIGHFYVAGSEKSEGLERDISLGGAYAVSPGALPKNADYIALGHLHRAQRAAGFGAADNVYYSGSPIAYSLSEINYAKSVNIVDLSKNGIKTEKRLLNCPKPIEDWRFDSIENAIKACGESGGRDCFVYITINSPRAPYQNEIKEMRALKKDIIRIEVLTGQDGFDNGTSLPYAEKPVAEEFADFYESERGIRPPAEIIRIFNEALLTDDADDIDGDIGGEA